MYSFEGDFRRKPIQSLGGASKKEQKSALLVRTQEERRKRREAHDRNLSAIKIQSFYRASTIRGNLRNFAREDLDKIISLHKRGEYNFFDVDKLHKTLRLFIFSYREAKDSERLIWLGQQLIKQPKIIGDLIQRKDTGLYQTQQILHFCCRQIIWPGNRTLSQTVPLRLLEIFTSPESFQTEDKDLSAVICHKVLAFLIIKGYFHCLRILLEQRVPSSVEYSCKAPTPIAGSILTLLYKPLHALSPHHLDFRDNCLQSLCTEFFSSPFSEQISQFLLPALAQSKQLFPFHDLLKALIPADINLPEASKQSWDLKIKHTPWMLYALLTLSHGHLENLDRAGLYRYLMALHKLVPQIERTRDFFKDEESDSEEEMDDDHEDTRLVIELNTVKHLCVTMLNQPNQVSAILSAVNQHPQDASCLSAVCTIAHALLVTGKVSVHKTRLLYLLAFNTDFLRSLWFACASITSKRITGDVVLLQQLAKSAEMTKDDMHRIIPLLAVFSSLFTHLLLSLDDDEFFRTSTTGRNNSMPFTIPEVVHMTEALRDVCLGIIEIAHPDSKPTIVRQDYQHLFQSSYNGSLTTQELHEKLNEWAYLFRVVVRLVRQLYGRHTRRPFCPPQHWLSPQISINHNQPPQFFQALEAFSNKPFGARSSLNMNKLEEEDGPSISNTKVRQLTVLAEFPYVIPFEERVKIFHKLIHHDKSEHQGEMHYLQNGRWINISIRRNFLYEDAFEKLSPENEPNLKMGLRVQLINFAGLDEAGIDGGGLFREFLSELLKTAFDPNRGFFQYTTDKLLYPNPQSKHLVEKPDIHYYFMGRILAKAIYENMLVELPLASFFLSKILSRTREGDVDIHNLQSLDPDLYRNLLSLKNMDQDVADLALDFSVVDEGLGETRVVELKSKGQNIQVTNSNKIEYIYLMADYRLNKQIRNQVNAFRQGMSDVLNLEWLRMFDSRELQILISGAQEPIDLDDLRRHTNYAGGYSQDHIVIQSFWRIIESFSDKQKSQLLKFVTSCSRPPLLGFKDLYPAFCIHHGGTEPDRLPTASTCMNLLKLPEIQDDQLLRSKLLYSIESCTGFELS